MISTNKQMTTGGPRRNGGMIRLRERFYGDGPPHWTVGRKEKQCETADEAEHAWKIAIKRLKDQAKSTLDADRALKFEEIADAIKNCRPDQRCRHSACPLCLRALQRWFVWTAPTALRIATRSSGERLVAISVIPNLRVKVGASVSHTNTQLTRVLTTLRKGLEQAGVQLLCGGIDLSVNEEPTTRSSSDIKCLRVQNHLWAIGPETDIRHAESTIREIFAQATQIPRPVKIDRFDGRLKGYAYALKTNFQRRIRLAPKLEYNRRWNTRSKALTVEQTAEVMMLLEMIGDRRLFLIGAELTKNRKNRTVIRPV